MNEVMKVYSCMSCPLEVSTMDGPTCSHEEFKGYGGMLLMTPKERRSGTHKNCPLKKAPLVKTVKSGDIK